MTTEHESLRDHEEFRELGCLASAGSALTADESAKLASHLRNCEECNQAFHQYTILSTNGIPSLADAYDCPQRRGSSNDTATWDKLFARVRIAERRASSGLAGELSAALMPRLLQGGSMGRLARAAFAAGLIVMVGVGGYRWGSHREPSEKKVQTTSEDSFQKLATANRSIEELLNVQTKRLFQLQKENSQKEQELTKLHATLHALEDHSIENTVAKSAIQESLRTVSQERDILIGQLRDAETAYGKVQAELVNLRAERDKILLRTTSLESRIGELTATNQDQEKKLKDDEGFLAYDRDIRELMGARKLYIADVFDVDSRSHTEKAGRVFYTQGKSLIFYAFDLDRQPGTKNSAAFQAWGQKEASEGKPLNLGVFYLDNAANRRWVLRCDDPKQLAEIDAVFVTVEPRGGSDVPTGRALLYASLRREANHP
jgi:hypothetical protein